MTSWPDSIVRNHLLKKTCKYPGFNCYPVLMDDPKISTGFGSTLNLFWCTWQNQVYFSTWAGQRANFAHAGRFKISAI